jgi:preprotein translocase subunit SecA
MVEDTVDELLSIYCPDDKHIDEWDNKGLNDAVYGTFSIVLEITPDNRNALRNEIIEAIKKAYEKKEADIGSDIMRYLEKVVMLQVIDIQWKDHLFAMDHLKEGIGLRGYGQRDPLVEYKREAFEVFADMTSRISFEVLRRLFKIQVQKKETIQNAPARQTNLNYNRGEGPSPTQPKRSGKKIGRNEPCPCGSGKKFKKCCGMNA